MIQFSIFLACILGLLSLALLFPVRGFLKSMECWKPNRLSDDACPLVAIILPLRGYDPFFELCLTRLLAQDYPNYELRIVIDSTEDPAWEPVHRIVAELKPSHVKIESLEHRFETCGLKNSSVLQGITGLDDSFEVVALVDSDTVPHPMWLRDLVSPLADERIAVSSGQRWYMPDSPTIGSLTRYVWNALNSVAMANTSVWGGSFAIKRRVLDEVDLLQCWQKSLSEDVLIYGRIKRAGYKMAFVPLSVMINRETCSVLSFVQWLSRQVLLGRLYHFGWPLFLTCGLGATLVLLTAVAFTVYSIATNQLAAAAWVGGALLVQFVSVAAILLLLERATRRIVRWRDEDMDWLTSIALWKMLIAIPLTQFVFTVALLKAAVMRQVEWRGVTYKIHGPWNIHLVEYRPFVARDDAPSAMASI